jgi:hypothetical protein
VVRCDAVGVEAQAQAVAKAASVAALEQFKISADRESLAPLASEIRRRCCLRVSCMTLRCGDCASLVNGSWCAI